MLEPGDIHGRDYYKDENGNFVKAPFVPYDQRKRFCFDLDGTLCRSREENQEYKDVEPIKGMCALVRRLKCSGHYIIIYTARNMVTFDGNVGKIIKHQVPIIQEWLKKHDVPYDELVVGKPHADYFVDDKGVNPLTLSTTELRNLLTQ